MINRRDFTKTIFSIPIVSCLGKYGFSGNKEDKLWIGGFGEITNIEYSYSYEYGSPLHVGILDGELDSEILSQLKDHDTIRRHLETIYAYRYDSIIPCGKRYHSLNSNGGGLTSFPHLARIEITTNTGVSFNLQGFNCHPIREFEKILANESKLGNTYDNLSIENTDMKLCSIEYGAKEENFENMDKYLCQREFCGPPPEESSLYRVYKGEYRYDW
jgi:hypothetical protein